MGRKIQFQRDCLLKILRNLKMAGYRTYISRNEDYAYGMVTDGTHFVGINSATYGTGFSLDYSYVPSRKYGSRVAKPDMDTCFGKPEITETDVLECIAYGSNYALSHHIPCYSGLDKYMERHGQYYQEVSWQ